MKARIDHLIEVSGVYDGWSIAVVSEPRYMYINRWSVADNPLVAASGYDRRFRETEEYIERSGVTRGRLADIEVWAEG